MRRVREEVATIAVAVQFLTRLPISSSVFTPERLAASVRYYPLVGALVGLIGAAVYWLSAQALPPVLAALLSTATTLLATGAFHEDGLADLFDGLGAPSRERMLEVMRDSRIGTFGAAALGLVLAMKVTALAALPVMIAAAALVAAHVVSRSSSVVAIATSRYVRSSGTAKPVADGVGGGGLAVALLTAIAVIAAAHCAIGLAPSLVAAGGALAGHVAARLLYERRLGGYTGDCLGAVQQMSELGFYLGLLACL